MNVTVDVIDDLLDTMMLESPLPYDEGIIDYDIAKQIIISGSIEQVLTILNATSTTPDQKAVSLITAMSYLCMENFLLHVKNNR
jgi:hypothetical protein